LVLVSAMVEINWPLAFDSALSLQRRQPRDRRTLVEELLHP
jgi:hypothetical protein